MTTTAAPELLRVFMARRDLEVAAFARELGIAPSYLSHLRKGHRAPGRALASKIAALTAGAVPMESWDAPSSSPGVVAAPTTTTPSEAPQAA